MGYRLRLPSPHKCCIDNPEHEAITASGFNPTGGPIPIGWKVVKVLQLFPSTTAVSNSVPKYFRQLENGRTIYGAGD